MIDFIRSEEGGTVEWIVGAVILGLGMLPVLYGISNALNQSTQKNEETIRSIVESGY